MTDRLVAVIDIGKTNKKIALYDEALHQVAFREQAFAAAPGLDGILCEPVEPMWAWFKANLRELHAHHPFHAIAVTTHGATFACLDGGGALAVPVVAYDHPLDDAAQADLDRRFYALCGDPGRLQDETATCDLPLLINPAKALLFYRDRWPGRFADIRCIVNYPQYWGWRLTGEVAAEPTYTANHSFLFDLRQRRPSSAARALGLAHAVDCDLRNPWDRLGILAPSLQAELGLPPIPVAVGIHDSNAALLPYLVAHRGRDFVLNSTGTWCVAMHRVDDVRYVPEELGQKIIFNLDALGGHQKTSFLMGGQEYACYHDLIGGDHIVFDPAATDAALASIHDRILPGAFPSQFPKMHGGASEGHRVFSLADLRAGRRPSWFNEHQRAHILLNVALALQTKVALERTGIGPRTAIFIEGGFRRNQTYRNVLAALFSHTTVSCTSLAQATATGTALLGFALLDGCDPTAFADRLDITEEPVPPPRLSNLARYAQAYLAAVR